MSKSKLIGHLKRTALMTLLVMIGGIMGTHVTMEKVSSRLRSQAEAVALCRDHLESEHGMEFEIPLDGEAPRGRAFIEHNRRRGITTT